MPDKIFPCLWFDGNAKEAADFYCSIFKQSKITTNTPMVVQFEIEGKKIMGLNGGPKVKINPSVSLFVTCETEEEIESVWKKLSEGGSTMMALDKYPWSEKYGWVVDKFGMTWQLMLGELPGGAGKIIPSFLFVGVQFGKAKEAIELYTSVFPGSNIHTLQMYDEGEVAIAGALKFGHFELSNSLFAAMDGPGDHNFHFNDGVSLFVECENQEEIDSYWLKLTANGGQEVMCGWLKDKFGVSWQIVPKSMGKLMSDPEKAPRVMKAFMQMKKLDIAAMENA